MLLVLALTMACNLAPKAIDDTDTDDTDGGGPTVSAFDVNDGSALGDVVVENLVVTSPVTRDGLGFFVADVAGGAGSGLYVWRQMGMEDLTVHQGDTVRITGNAQDYYGWTELVISNVDAVEVTGEADVPAPVDVSALGEVDWNAYESVLVTLTDQDVVSVNEFSTGTLSGGVALDDGFTYLDYDCGGHFDTVTGIVFYSYEVWSVNPRTTDELAGYTPPDPVDASIEAIQTGSLCGGSVTLTDVVVTTPSFGEEDGEATFFVQDATGENHGLAIYISSSSYAVNVGDVLTITGSPSEYYEFTEIFVEDVADITVTGTSAAQATPLATAPADWEPWEGQLVTLSNVTVTSDPDEYGTATTDQAIGLDDQFYDASPGSGDVYASITGVITYSFEAWKILPRSADDVLR